MLTTSRPGIGEYALAVADYVAAIGDGEDVLAVLAAQLEEIQALLGPLPGARSNYRYASDKWTLKEVIGHLTDTERVWSYRALQIGRGDTSPIPGIDDQAWIAELGTEHLALADMVEEWGLVRRATLALFRHLPAAAWLRQGTADGKPISVRALSYVIAGHTRHHMEVVAARYLL